MKQKQNYQRPTTKFVQLRHKTHLLQTSRGRSSSAGVTNYTWKDENEE